MSTSFWRDLGGYKSRFLRGAHLPAMLRGTCLRYAAWCLGGMRAVLWHGSGGGLPLPQDKAPSTLARGVIHFGPESRQWDSGSLVLRSGGGSQNLVVAVVGAHTASKNPRIFSRIQAYIAYLHGS
jgi:hypothetical protein